MYRRRRLRPTPLVVATLVTLVVFTACDATTDDRRATAEEHAPPTTLRIDQIVSRSGSGTAYGASQANGLELAVRGLGPIDPSVTINLTTHDDRSEPDAARRAMETSARSDAVAVIGPTLSPAAAVANPVAAPPGLPVLAATNATLDLAALPTTWRVSQTEAAMIDAAVKAVAADTRVGTVALITDTGDEYATAAGAAFRVAATGAGWAVTDVSFDGADNAALGAGQALAQAPDALLLAARSQAASAIAIATYGFDGPRIGSNGFNAPDVLEAAGAAADEIVVGGSWNFVAARESQSVFINAYRRTFDRDPDAFAALAYASAQLIVAAAVATDDRSRSGMTRALSQLDEVDTVLGRVRFQGHELVYPVVVQVIEDGVLLPRS